MTSALHFFSHRVPIHTFIGLALIIIAWPVAWLSIQPYSYYTFLYLSLGYILTVDGLNVARHHSSPLSRSPFRFVLLFVLSAPVWWLFEFLNGFTQNWHYLGGQVFGEQADLIATLHFTTVIPAVFETAELWGSAAWVRRAAHGRKAVVNRFLEVSAFILGWVSLACLMINPSVSFSLIWMCVLLCLDPLNAWLGQPSLIRQIARGDWQNVLSLAAAGLTCGFFWEMWNYYSYPKWYYTVPHVSFLKIFEMPILGYLGYIPFAMELYAVYQTVRWFVRPVAVLVGSRLENADRQRT